MTFAYIESILSCMKPRKRMGRPPKKLEDKYSQQVNVRMTKDERKRLEAEAARLGISLSALLMRPWRQDDPEGE